jgi:Lon protease-like protein
MTNFIPIFPLAIAVFPGEKLNLHVFEPRYIQLILSCVKTKKPFGIPIVVNGKISDIGTLVEIVEISANYENGEMDIKTKGLTVFHVLEIIQEIPEKLYSGAIVSYPRNEAMPRPEMMKKIIVDVALLHKLLAVKKEITAEGRELLSYDFAHHIGMSIEEEFEFLQLLQEDQRLEFMRRHLKKVIPVLKDMEILKKKIQLNGHFRNLEGFKFS